MMFLLHGHFRVGTSGDLSVVAVVVKTERLALTVVVTLCQCREMDVKEECMAIKFCCKVDFSATKAVELIQKAYGDAALS